MNGEGIVLAVCGGMAVLALVLSLTPFQRHARAIAQLTLLLTLAAVPVAMLFDVVFTDTSGADTASKATLLAKSISHAMNFAVLMLPCAGLAVLALRRVNARRG